MNNELLVDNCKISLYVNNSKVNFYSIDKIIINNREEDEMCLVLNDGKNFYTFELFLEENPGLIFKNDFIKTGVEEVYHFSNEDTHVLYSYHEDGDNYNGETSFTMYINNKSNFVKRTKNIKVEYDGKIINLYDLIFYEE